MLQTQRGAHTIFDIRRTHQDDSWSNASVEKPSFDAAPISSSQRSLDDEHASSFLADRGDIGALFKR